VTTFLWRLGGALHQRIPRCFEDRLPLTAASARKDCQLLAHLGMHGRIGRTMRISIQVRSQIVCVMEDIIFLHYLLISAAMPSVPAPPTDCRLADCARVTDLPPLRWGCCLVPSRHHWGRTVAVCWVAMGVAPNQPPAASLSHISMHYSTGCRCTCHRIDVAAGRAHATNRRRRQPPDRHWWHPIERR
jgi:hypothetical protein